jgi:acyl-CoA dehydrogenase
MDSNELLEPFARILADVATPAEIRRIEADGLAGPLWDAVEASGYLDALVPEDKGGVGLTLAQVEPMIRALGQHAAPIAIAETMVARGLGAQALPRPIAAVIRAIMIAGAGERVLDMTLAHANDRIQFGKPIAKQQALQQNLAVMGEQVILARIAGQMGCRQGLVPSDALAAVAKQVASAAVPVITSIAHAVHGAIGITAEYDLQLYTRQMHVWRAEQGSEGYWARAIGRSRWDAAQSGTVDFLLAI